MRTPLRDALPAHDREFLIPLPELSNSGCRPGKAGGSPPLTLGFVLGGTPEFLLDTRKGLYSYEALQSRLATNSFAQEGLVDMTGPIVRLANLSPEDLYVLLGKIRDVYAAGDSAPHPVPDEAIHAFMQHCSQRIGEAYFRTPRNTIKEFVNLLAVLDQNPEVSWQQLVGTVEIPAERNPDLAPIEESNEDDDGLASFQL